jgi:hypothetical protein
VVAVTKSISDSEFFSLVADSSGNALYFITNSCLLDSGRLERMRNTGRWTLFGVLSDSKRLFILRVDDIIISDMLVVIYLL